MKPAHIQHTEDHHDCGTPARERQAEEDRKRREMVARELAEVEFEAVKYGGRR